MQHCPVCSTDNPDDALECQRCKLSIELFGAVKEAAGEPAPDPKYLATIGEILSAAGAEGMPEVAVESVGARLLRPARFPSVNPPSASPARPAGPRPVDSLPALPALPPGDVVPTLRRQLAEYLTLARRQGIDTTLFREQVRQATESENREALEALTRELFVHITSALADQYQSLLGRRNELAGLLSTASADVELESCRSSIALGDMGGAQRRLRHIDDSLTLLEDEWATVQILLTEADLLSETLRELGTDPAPALGPLAEGRRLAQGGDREAAERLLARATLALWTLLSPSFYHELNRIKDAVLRMREEGQDVGPTLQHLREVAAYLKHRNFGALIASYRRLREAVALSPLGPPGPVSGSKGLAATRST
ncbi:MAG: hypothetical protein L3K09_01275 [Thermoplasmata archaeon]|nr:hypothetical protein [Thermoplasmata archaeon]